MASGSWRRRLSDKGPLALSMIAGGAFVGLPFALPGSGGTAWVIHGASIFVAMLPPLAVQLQERQAAKANHLQANIEVQLGRIAALADGSELIEAWVAAEREACLASVRKPTGGGAPSGRGRGFDASAVPSELADAVPADLDQQAKASRLAGREFAGLVDAQTTIASAFENVATAMDFLSIPDSRSEDDYHTEVDEYLAEGASALSTRLEQEFLARGLGRLRLVLVNPTDRPYQGIRVELRVPAGVHVVGELPREWESAHLPPRPRPFGARMSRFGTTSSAYVLGVSAPRLRSNPTATDLHPRIDESEHGSHVTFPPVNLRAQDRLPLMDLHLLARSAPGSVIEIRWEATAATADARGRISGTAVVPVEAGRPADELLAEALRPDSDD